MWDIRNEKKNYDNSCDYYDYRPVIEFEENVNSTNIQYGFDVNLKEDIVAIGIHLLLFINDNDNDNIIII